MFTGIVEERGQIINRQTVGDGYKFTVKGDVVSKDIKINDSMSVNGCCQTIIEVTGNTFSYISIEETLKKTTFGSLQIGDAVNLERAMLPDTRLGGHFVTGHIDCVGLVTRKSDLKTSWEFDIEFPPEYQKYMIKIGSVSVDGVSLTVADLKANKFMVAIIPHTMEKTIFNNYDVGTKVNLEFDMIGKYIEKIMTENMRNEG